MVHRPQLTVHTQLLTAAILVHILSYVVRFPELLRFSGQASIPAMHAVRAMLQRPFRIECRWKLCLDNSSFVIGSLAQSLALLSAPQCCQAHRRQPFSIARRCMNQLSDTGARPVPHEQPMGFRQLTCERERGRAGWSSLPELLAARILQQAFRTSGRTLIQWLRLSLVSRCDL